MPVTPITPVAAPSGNVPTTPKRKRAKVSSGIINATIPGGAGVVNHKPFTTKLKVGSNFDIRTLKVDLSLYADDNIDISLTSPSGRKVFLKGYDENLEPQVTTTAFAGEKTKGTWTLNIRSNDRRDYKVEEWGLEFTQDLSSDHVASDPNAPNDKTSGSGEVNINATSNGDGTFSLIDPSRGSGVETLDQTGGNEKVFITPEPRPFIDHNNTWGEELDDPRAAVAAEAQYDTQMTYDFFRNVLGRNSYDGNGAKMTTLVQQNRNERWDPSAHTASVMTGWKSANGSSGPDASLDYVGMQYGLGLVQHDAGLLEDGGTGTLQDSVAYSMSHIIGTGVEWYAAQGNPNVISDWAVPDWQDWLDGSFRRLDDPQQSDEYDHYSQIRNVQRPDTLRSAGIMDNAFYLLAHGGKNRTSQILVTTPIGMEKALKIFGRSAALLTGDKDLKSARTATLAAAQELFGAGSGEEKAVADAWKAVGL